MQDEFSEPGSRSERAKLALESFADDQPSSKRPKKKKEIIIRKTKSCFSWFYFLFF